MSQKQNTIVLLGNFDGVHLGHRELIKAGQALKEQTGMPLILFAFDSLKEPYLTSVKERSRILSSLNVDAFALYSFDSLRNMSNEDFVSRILKDEMSCKYCICGYNYSFGKGGKGNADILNTLCSQNEITLVKVDKVTYKGEEVSSSRIRELLASGDVKTAARLLTYNYTLKGKVGHGSNLGQGVNMPTANLVLSESGMCLPKNGVYATYTSVSGKKYPSLTNVGVRPTLNDGRGVQIESHILDFEYDIYGKEIEIEFLFRIRDEKTFSSLNDVKSQVEKDKEKALKYFK